MRIAIARADAATLLSRALRVSAAPHGVSVDAMTITDRAWASATYEGTQHVVRLTITGEHAHRWLETLADAELPIRGHIVADLTIDAIQERDDGLTVSLAALTLAEY